jgi:hypothetical protein
MLTSSSNNRGKTTVYNFCLVQIHHNTVNVPPLPFYRSPSFLALIGIMLKFEIKLRLYFSDGTFSNTVLAPVQQPASLETP